MGCVCFMYIKIELESVGTWWRQNAAIEVNPLVWMVIPVSDDKSIIKQVLPKRSVSTRLADDHDSLAPQNVSLIKKMTLYHSKWLWNSVHYKLISNYGSENEVYHIFSALPSLRRFTESVVICLKRMLRRARSFHCFPWIRRYFTCLAHLFDHYTFSVCVYSATFCITSIKWFH